LNLQEAIHDYIIYNHWSNKKMTQWLKGLDSELLYTETESSFASIDLTLQHMKNAQNFWYAIITKKNVEKLDERIIVKSTDTVIEELLQGSQKMADTYTKFNDQELLTKVTSPAMTKSRYDFIFHVINHNSYHRGQIVTIARFLGITKDIPETDYEAFLWFEQINSKNLDDSKK
jgi:uncharacterized damage-inducible protein DinB